MSVTMVCHGGPADGTVVTLPSFRTPIDVAVQAPGHRFKINAPSPADDPSALVPGHHIVRYRAQVSDGELVVDAAGRFVFVCDPEYDGGW